MELLVALALFAVTTGIIADLFVTASRQQARTAAVVRVQGDARLILETIARELREGTIDYDSYATHAPKGTLALRDADGASLWFDHSTSDCPTDAPACIRIGRPDANGVIAWAPLSGSGVDAQRFDVAVLPAGDPFAVGADGTYAYDQQPMVTVSLALATTTGRPGDRPSIEVQTTVVSRVYKR